MIIRTDNPCPKLLLRQLWVHDKGDTRWTIPSNCNLAYDRLDRILHPLVSEPRSRAKSLKHRSARTRFLRRCRARQSRKSRRSSVSSFCYAFSVCANSNVPDVIVLHLGETGALISSCWIANNGGAQFSLHRHGYTTQESCFHFLRRQAEGRLTLINLKLQRAFLVLPLAFRCHS